MKLHTKNLYAKASLLLLGGYFLTFLTFYFANVLFYDTAVFSYLWYFVQKATFLLLPLLSALLTLIAYAYSGFKLALVALIPLSTVKAVYSLPYYYLNFVYEPYYDSVDALLLAAVRSILEIAALYAFTLIIFFIMKLILDLLGKKKESYKTLLSKKTTLDFADPVSLTFMICALLCFAYFFVGEIIDTASIIAKYEARLTGAEIVYMIFSYVFDVILLALHYLALSYLKNYIIDKRVKNDTEN